VECPRFTANDTHVQVFSSRMKIPTKLSLSLLSLTVLWGGWLHCPADGNKDVDECTSHIHGCHYNASCNNTDGSYTCKCKTGFNC
ncbi:unnamed protein product, partial [Pocillopora meandrina]